MSFNYFSSDQIFPFIVGSIILFISLVFYNIPKTKRYALPLLVVASLVIGYFMANLDPYLNLWDEQYHAVVAKNLISNPLKPTLYIDPILGYDYQTWTNNHVWLHKQPLFLWQMALSIKLFGVNALAVRIPSVIMHAIIPIFIYRIGVCAKKRDSGYYGALLFAVAYFPLELIVGKYSTDHNDIAFLFYLTGSFWAWFEYERTKRWQWIVLIGLFSGGAVLVKWLMGTLVLIVWFLSTFLFDSAKRWKLKSYFHLAFASIVSIVVFLPWQLYAIYHYPKEYFHEYERTNAHLWEAIEGHSESVFFHFTDGLKTLYGSGALTPFILLGALILLVVKLENVKHKFVIAFSVIFVYLLYTLAQTKMIAFPIIVAPFIFLALGNLMSSFFKFIASKVNIRWVNFSITIGVVLLFSYMNLNLKKIQNYHTDWRPNDNENRAMELAEMESIELIKESVDQDYVVFNTNITYDGRISTMFYTGTTAYGFIPSIEQLNTLKRLKKKIAILDMGNLPSYIIDDSAIKKIHFRKKE